MKRSEDTGLVSRRSPKNSTTSNTSTSISELARRFGAQSLRQQCAVPSPINEDFAHQPSRPFTNSQSLFHTVNPFARSHLQRPPSPLSDSEGLISPLESCGNSYFPPPPQSRSAPVSHRPSSASDDTTRTDASSPPPSVFSNGSFAASSYSSPPHTRPGSSASTDSISYTGASDHGIRRQRQRILRRQTSNSHLAEVRALISRMVDKGEMCEVNNASRPSSPSPETHREPTPGDVKQEEADSMDLDGEGDFTSRPPSSRSGSDLSSLTTSRSRASSGLTSSERSSVSSNVKKEPRVQKRSQTSQRSLPRR